MVREKIDALVNAHEKDYETIGIILDLISAFSAYVKIVNDMENLIHIRKLYMEAEDFRETLSNINSSRTRIHNSIINACKVLNRMAVEAGLPLIFEGNVEVRHEVARFAGELTLEIFTDGIQISK
jgi:hypothetical protein